MHIMTILTQRSFLLALLFIGFLISCDKSSHQIQKEPSEALMLLADKNAAFGWSVFQQSAIDQNDDNVLLSPLSIQIALSMALNGAEGETLDQMLEMLKSNSYTVNELNKDMKQLLQLLSEESGHPTLTIRNGFFYDPLRVKVEENFNQVLKSNYFAQVSTDNFNDPAAKDRINQWVKQATKGKIDEIIDGIKQEDLAFLINALHFKADWATAFDPQMTFKSDFSTQDGKKVQLDFMAADRDFHAIRTDKLMMVDIPFRDSTYSLSLIMDTDEAGTSVDWISSTSYKQLTELWDQMSYGRAFVNLPRFKLEHKEQMIKTLKALGMVDAFDPYSAKFGKLGRSLIGPTLYISSVQHKAVLEVDEKGAEGAAVTSITFSTTSMPPVFQFNRPFVLLLRHIPTNALVFTGKVIDPS
jgi:serine protease inhibitor